ncbi:DUF4148 domain-containing protein [Undibacterium sp. SXout7W]|uniref:DUF4148 domain-containing protein n=1 Tax=Undibacterium sp. SXout7W TaxID=3413049 RepID=UPI003BEF90F3
MNTKTLLAVALLSLSAANMAFAEDAATSPKTRAEVIAELKQARAQGEEIGMEGFSWYPAQRAELAKANAATKSEAMTATKSKPTSSAQ